MGYYENELLNIKDIRISTDLLTASGFGSIKPSTQSLNISLYHILMMMIQLKINTEIFPKNI